MRQHSRSALTWPAGLQLGAYRHVSNVWRKRANVHTMRNVITYVINRLLSQDRVALEYIEREQGERGLNLLHSLMRARQT